MIGKEVSHYKILEELGRGGMGVVYKAEDTKLDRIVALKFLSPQTLGSKDDRARFVHEAKSAAGLDHPNICTIYEINEVDELTFIAMAYVEGQTLKDKIASGPLKLDEAIDIAIQVAEGLHAAHEKEIVHRDIKPANIMITPRGQAKIMDFGLAKSRGQTVLTKADTTLGTFAYMSPEQGQGEEIDSRTDIWSLGVVLYEMISGRRPFAGDYEQAVIYSILNEEPEPLTGLRTGVPLDLERIVTKCLRKEPEDRYQGAPDLVTDLRQVRDSVTSTRSAVAQPVSRGPTRRLSQWSWLAVVIVLVALAAWLLPRYLAPPSDETTDGRKMLVVLPFENLGSPDDEYFADGITEEITARLAGIHGLGVIARTSAIQYKNTAKTIPQIGEELGVEFVLEGTIRWQRASEGGSQVRVTPQLIRASDATHLWADIYQEDMTDIFDVQSDIAGRVAEALGITLLDPERRAVEAKPTDNLEAYDYYLRGKEYQNRSYSAEDRTIARQMFERAIQKDSTFALAWARKSRVISSMYWFDQDGTEDAQVKAKEAAHRALDLAPDLAEAHIALGYYHYWVHLDYDRALEAFYAAREIQPNNDDLAAGIGLVQRRQGKIEEALENLKSSYELDPLDWMMAYEVAETLAGLRRYEEAVRYLDRAIALRPEWSIPYAWKASLLIRWKGETSVARSVLEEASAHVDIDGEDFSFLRFRLERLDGNYDEALRWIQSFPDEVLQNHFVLTPRTLLVASIYHELGNNELARAYSDSARVALVALIEERPDDARLHSALGLAYAGLGRRDDAIREGKRAVEIMPLTRDAWRGVYNLQSLALIYVLTGDYDLAIDQLEHLLSIPSPVSTAQLRMDPQWDPLRGNPRFKRLLQEYGES